MITGSVLIAIGLGCGDDDAGPEQPGSGRDADTGDAASSDRRDAGTLVDARVPEDAGAQLDAGGSGAGGHSGSGGQGGLDAGSHDAGSHDADVHDDDAAVDPDPDFASDLDSDSDGITDADEGRAAARDSDGDGAADYLDTDSDDDCRPDAIEAGDGDPTTAPIDSDGDGREDACDLDSDADYVPDALEDANCDGAVSGAETSALLADSDSDGASDLLERALGTDPRSGLDDPTANGDLVFLAPYQTAPLPAQHEAEITTEVSQLDVFILMDTTGSMGGEINNLQSSFSSSLTAIAGVVHDVAIGVGGYDDFTDASGCYGNAASGDQPFYLRHRVMTTTSATGIASLQTALNGLAVHNGVDGPESGWQALYQSALGTALAYNGATVPAFDPATAPPSVVPAGEQVGTLDGVGFRAGALHAVVMVTDASSHNSTAYGADAAFGGSENLYGYGACPAVPVAATKTQAIDALVARGTRVLGIVSGGGTAEAKPDLATAVRATRASVPPAAWDDGARPAGCAGAQCCTGVNGSGVATAADGSCPLIYDLASTGVGLGSAFVDGLAGLVQFSRGDVGAAVLDANAGDAVDPALAFVDRVAATTSAGGPCATLTAIDSGSDGTADRFQALPFGSDACFAIIAKPNTSVAGGTDPQVFEATLTASAEGGVVLGERRVYFVVPPAIATL